MNAYNSMNEIVFATIMPFNATKTGKYIFRVMRKNIKYIRGTTTPTMPSMANWTMLLTIFKRKLETITGTIVRKVEKIVATMGKESQRTLFAVFIAL